MRLPGLPVEGPLSHVPTCLHSFITVNSRPTRPRRAPLPPASVDPILRQPGLRHDPASVDPQHLSLGRNTGPAWPGVIPTPSQFDPLRPLHGRPHGRYCGRRSRVHHKDAEAATHGTGQSALRSPHLLGPLRSIHQHRLLPGSYPGTAGPLHPLSGGTPARPVWARSPLPARILHGRRRHSNRTTTMADSTKRPAVCPSWPSSPGGMLTVHGHLPCAPLGLDSVYQRAACELEPGPRQPLLRPYHGGRRLGREPLGRGTSWHCPTGWLRRSAPSVVSPLRSPGPAWAALRSPLRPASPSPFCGCRAATHKGWQSAAALLPGPPLRISHYYRRLVILLQAWLIALPLPTHGVEHRPGAAGCARADISSSTPHPPTSTSTPEG